MAVVHKFLPVLSRCHFWPAATLMTLCAWRNVSFKKGCKMADEDLGNGYLLPAAILSQRAVDTVHWLRTMLIRRVPFNVVN